MQHATLIFEISTLMIGDDDLLDDLVNPMIKHTSVAKINNALMKYKKRFEFLEQIW